MEVDPFDTIEYSSSQNGVSQPNRAEEEAAGHKSAAPAALVALHEFLGGSSIDQLRQVVGLTASGAVRLVDKLAEAGLVRRGLGAETVLAGLSSDERDALTPLLERLLEQLTAARLAEREEARTPAGGWLCRLCDFSACRRKMGACPVANAAQPTSGSPGDGA